ncbi:MAG: aquaporin [Paracoccaceae bacterium]|jgi:glycerol uptake facilitator-like aquaporin
MSRSYAAELTGTLILVMCGIGTGIMGTDLAQGNLAVALFANAFATGLVLYLLITILGPISGAHMNPAVTLYFALSGETGAARAAGYVAAQLVGAALAIALTHLMFGQPLLQTATTVRAAPGLWLGEAIATFGLCLTIAGARLHAPGQLPALVGAWIAAAFWFTSSASFANPAVTFARMFSDTFTGIQPADAPAYVAAQLGAAIVAARALPKLFSR